MIKITPADSAFSKCVRARANWKCERCGSRHERNSSGLHCSHFIGRGNWSVRFEPLNAIAACYGCHMHLQGDPVEHRELMAQYIGNHGVDFVVNLSNNTEEGRRMRKTKGKGAIAKHFRDEYARMVEIRDNARSFAGEVSVEFEGWK